jgi:TPR repeat protein
MVRNILLTLPFVFLFVTDVVKAQGDVDYEAIGKQGIEAYHKGDLIRAMELLERAAQHGYAPAQTMLAYFLDKSDLDEQAFKWYSSAAEQGDAEGQFGLAQMYANGEGVEKNENMAREWMLKAVEQKHPNAMRMYASALESGRFGIPLDRARALAIYQACHAEGDMACSKRLVLAYRHGELGLPVDRKKSEQLNIEMFRRETEQKQK